MREIEGILRKQVMLEENKKRQREVGQRLAMQRLCLTEIDQEIEKRDIDHSEVVKRALERGGRLEESQKQVVDRVVRIRGMGEAEKVMELME